MIKLLTFAGLGLVLAHVLIPPPAQGQAPELITGQLVQWTAGDSGAATSVTTYLESVTSGNLMLVFSHWDNQALRASVTDSMGNKYLPVGGPVNAGTTARFQAWYAKNIRGGRQLAMKVTYSGKTTSFSLIDAVEYSGLDRSAPLDVLLPPRAAAGPRIAGPLRPQPPAAKPSLGCSAIPLTRSLTRLGRVSPCAVTKLPPCWRTERSRPSEAITRGRLPTVQTLGRHS